MYLCVDLYHDVCVYAFSAWVCSSPAWVGLGEGVTGGGYPVILLYWHGEYCTDTGNILVTMNYWIFASGLFCYPGELEQEFSIRELNLFIVLGDKLTQIYFMSYVDKFIYIFV